MPIPFTQFLLPRGERRQTQINRPAQIEAEADAFINSGGRFESEMLADLQTVSLTAVHKVDGDDADVACEICENGPAVLDAVDRLVYQAAEWMAGRPA